MAYISSYRIYGESIEPKKLFGRDANTLFEACKKVLNYKLYGVYANCYRAPMPCFFKMKREGKVASMSEYCDFEKSWYAKHPEEHARVLESRRQAEEDYAKQFCIIYGIAKRHHVYLIWDGEDTTCCMPDRWEIHKGGKRIGRINM